MSSHSQLNPLNNTDITDIEYDMEEINKEMEEIEDMLDDDDDEDVEYSEDYELINELATEITEEDTRFADPAAYFCPPNGAPGWYNGNSSKCKCCYGFNHDCNGCERNGGPCTQCLDPSVPVCQEPADEKITCKVCGGGFTHTAERQKEFKDKNWPKPTRCPTCNQLRKQSGSVSHPVPCPVAVIVSGPVTIENIGNIASGTYLYQGKSRKQLTCERYNRDTHKIFLKDEKNQSIKIDLASAQLFWTRD